jgi:hypothetical protein
MAFPVRAPPDLGHGHVVAPLLIDTTVEGRPRKTGRGSEQAGVAVRVRSHHRSADLAD